MNIKTLAILFGGVGVAIKNIADKISNKKKAQEQETDTDEHTDHNEND